MSKYWKQPDEKEWFMFIVDGKCLGVMEDGSAATKREIKRLGGYKGIKILSANHEALRAHNARTELPRRILNKMLDMGRGRK